MASPSSPQRRRSSRGPSLAPLYGGVIVAILAIVVVALAKKNDKAREAAEQSSADQEVQAPKGNPFSRTARTPDLDDAEVLPAASEDLLEAEVWIQALATAEKGLIELRSARERRDAGNTAAYVDGAVRARDLFNQALDDTVQWELDIVAAHGESDPIVRQVQEKRGEWFQHRKSLRKVHMMRR